ncbi:hypothetical protein F6X40_10175 [Paraburkholderia sp. UCT31]|uniref:hypothetical protein n=1 Tax=Paraburkholderia sp. UCT31 TaxID=2615209 RepID=UPI0016556F32|nr:hypothetical protein [Paraburkholderia sp. UCT31]MBC8737174.1 hypothetical protein [Paraburkholderia sp. UCT31]
MFDFPQYVPLPKTSRSADPLGLQSSNMARYRSVFSGMNNGVRYIRVYSAICWMVKQVWLSLPEDSDDDEVKAAFEAGLPKIQLLLVWGNKRWGTSLPGTDRKWPEETDDGMLTYAERPTAAAYEAQEDEDGDAKNGTTLLASDWYLPSATWGFGFLDRHERLDSAFRLTAGGERLADAYQALLDDLVARAKLKRAQVEWLRSRQELTINAAGVEQLREVLRLDAPTRLEQERFVAQFYPLDPDAGFPALFSARCRALTLALRAIAVEEEAATMPGQFVPVERIRHTMARGRATNGKKLVLEDLGDTPCTWQNLQVRQYMKLALETLFRASQHEIHHAVVKGYSVDSAGHRTARPRDIESIAARVGALAQASPTWVGHQTVGQRLAAIDDERGDAPSLYCAGATNPRLDIDGKFAELERLRRFTTTTGNVREAVGGALFALLWCASEARLMACDSLDGDRLTLQELREFTVAHANDSVEAYVATLVRDYVINQHFEVVRDRTEDDINARKPPKDRNRIVVGDEGLELNLSGSEVLSTVPVLSDTLLHALYLSAQAGLITQERDKDAFKLTTLGRRRAMQPVTLGDRTAAFNAAPVAA